MRILAVTNMYPSEGSPGQGVFVHEQIQSLLALGLRVQVLFIDRRRDGPWAYFRMNSRLAAAVAEFEPDLIHVMYGGVMAARVARARPPCPIIVTFHGSDLLGENLSGWFRQLVSRYGVWCSRRAAGAVEGIVVVARHLLRALPRTAFAAQVRVLPCGIDLDRFKPLNGAGCRRHLGWAPEGFHALFVSSNGDPVKRPSLARAAVQEMRARGVPVELHFLSGVPNEEMPVWLNAGDVLLLTSLHEGSPTVVKEALACGLPVVSVDVGDVAERIASIEGCHLAEPSPAALAGKLCLVQQRPARLNCRERLDDISSKHVARRLLAFYEHVARAGEAQELSSLNHRPEASPRSRALYERQTL